jgi:hypothetical protein
MWTTALGEDAARQALSLNSHMIGCSTEILVTILNHS